MGPAADDLEAASKFRAFWGAASELRRFQDGKISEAVVWGPGGTAARASAAAAGALRASAAARHAVPDQAVAYALRRHRPAGALGTLRSSGACLDGALRCALLFASPVFPFPLPHPLFFLVVLFPSMRWWWWRWRRCCRGEGGDPDVDEQVVAAERLLDLATDKLSKQLRALEGLALKVGACALLGLWPARPTASRETR